MDLPKKKNEGFTEIAMRVNQVREANTTKKEGIALVTTLAAGGLFFYSSPLWAVFGSTTLLLLLHDKAIGIFDIIVDRSIKHKINHVARRVKREVNVDIAPKYDYDNRRVGYVLLDENNDELTGELLTMENMQESLSPMVINTITSAIKKEFNKENEHRALLFSNPEPIDIDNMNRAFDKVGGLLSVGERLNMSFGVQVSSLIYSRFMRNRQDKSLWGIAHDLSEYLHNQTELTTNQKIYVLMEFENYFKKHGLEGEREFDKLLGKLKYEDTLEDVSKYNL